MFKYNQKNSYVGTSLSKCVISILKGEMDYKNVIGMITNTRCKDWATLYECIEMYLEGDMWGHGYWTKYKDRENEILELVWDMWNYKPFYQPRYEHGFVIVGEAVDVSITHVQGTPREPVRSHLFRDTVWLQVQVDTRSPWYSPESIDRRAERRAIDEALWEKYPDMNIYNITEDVKNHYLQNGLLMEEDGPFKDEEE